MSTGIEHVREQFHRRLKEGDILPAASPRWANVSGGATPRQPRIRGPSCKATEATFSTELESSANSTRVAMMAATARPICDTRRHRDSLR